MNRYTQTTEARQIRGPKGNREQLENPRSQAQRRPKVSKSVGKNTGEHDTQVPNRWDATAICLLSWKQASLRNILETFSGSPSPAPLSS